jgi:hypothetical protein
MEKTGFPVVELDSRDELCCECRGRMGRCDKGYVHKNGLQKIYHNQCGRGFAERFRKSPEDAGLIAVEFVYRSDSDE